jgi:2-polyprenyl-3-methyl-5-hydroxy-6-metoxy-1,4-benzoquinol methylase
MDYDPVKNKIHAAMGESVLARKVFFALMDRLFLRSRYVARELSKLRSGGLAPIDILDAGCGFGQYGVRMARLFPMAKVTAVEIKRDLVDSGNRFAQRARMKNVEFVAGDLCDLALEGRFDLALSVDVIEHIEDDRRVLGNVARSLKPGGIFVLTTPHWDGSKGELPPDFVVGEHVRPGYSREDLREKLESVGLDLEEFTITYGPWGHRAWQLLQKVPITALSARFWLSPIVPAYLGLAYPLAWMFMQLDMNVKNEQGEGVLAIARKKIPN